MLKKKRAARVMALSLSMAVVTVGLQTAGEGRRTEALSSGDTVRLSYDGYLRGTDDRYYITEGNGSFLYYNADGSTYVAKRSGEPDVRRRNLMLTDVDTGERVKGYCIEYATDVEKNSIYSSQDPASDARYFKNMPEDVKKLMLAAIYYGRNGINSVPVAGADDEDFYFATQVIIWEVQQQLRVMVRDSRGKITGTEKKDAHGLSKDFFYNDLKGRAAEKCYDYIVEKISSHYVTPAFIGESQEKAEAVEMKYSMKDKGWSAEIKDDTSGVFDLVWKSSDISYEKKGNTYCFSTEKALEGEKLLKVQRKTQGGSAAENLLIWHDASKDSNQVISTGSASPPQFYLRLKTDIPAEVTVEKRDAETGRPVAAAGTEFRIKSEDMGIYVSQGMDNPEGDIYKTDREGRVTIGERFQAGTFLLEEVKAPKGYVVAKEAVVFQVDGKSREITVRCDNKPQKGIITITKTGEYRHMESLTDIREKAMGGIDFDIIALADIVTGDGTVRAEKGEVVDTVRTDFKGNVSTKELYLGPYNIVERAAPEEYILGEPVNAALVYGDQETEVIEKKINLFNRLKRTPAPSDESPETGDDNPAAAAVMTLLVSLTLIGASSVFFILRREDR